jgi:DNA-3-methyladenine glycosylase
MPKKHSCCSCSSTALPHDQTGSCSLVVAVEAGVTAPRLRTQLSRPALDVAPALLGGLLTTRRSDGSVTVRITEVEAYEGERDPGSHAYRGQTARNAVMFGPAGHLYVYRHLGLHHCVNLVCGPVGTASAVLLRAGEVVQGAEIALDRRTSAGVCRSPVDLARGPARLAVALALTRTDDGVDVVGSGGAASLTLPVEPATEVMVGPRVGVSGEGGDAERHPWRFWIARDPTVSAYRRAL